MALLDLAPPQIPQRLSPGQAAQLSEMLEYFHIHMRRLIGEVEIGPQAESVKLGKQTWQQVIDLHARIAEYLRSIGDRSN